MLIPSPRISIQWAMKMWVCVPGNNNVQSSFAVFLCYRTEPFVILEPPNPSIHVSEEHKNRQLWILSPQSFGRVEHEHARQPAAIEDGASAGKWKRLIGIPGDTVGGRKKGENGGNTSILLDSRKGGLRATMKRVIYHHWNKASTERGWAKKRIRGKLIPTREKI